MADHGDKMSKGDMAVKEEMMPMPEGMVCCADGTYRHVPMVSQSGDQMPSEQEIKEHYNLDKAHAKGSRWCAFRAGRWRARNAGVEIGPDPWP